MRLRISTKGFNDIINLTPQVAKVVKNSGVKEGICVLFVPHSTCALTTIEYEEGLLEDLKRILERIAPMNQDYEHCKKWQDCNGYAHIRATLMKPCLLVPVKESELVLGTWQQIVLLDFDNQPREREILVQVIAK